MAGKTYILCLGSNVADGKHILIRVTELLSSKYDICAQSNIICTKDINPSSERKYFNIAVEISCDKEHDELKDELKAIERNEGREQGSADVTIDIDIIAQGRKIIHRDYYEYEYVRDLTNKLIMR